MALVADGGNCQADAECQSGACVALKCATPPLVDGVFCDSNTDCASNFCNYESPAYCDRKPLVDGRQCPASINPTRLEPVCGSGVCLNGRFAPGLPEDADCTPASNKPPCDPTLYCDTTLSPQLCRRKHGPGEDCTSSVQCYGSPGNPFACVSWGGRMICDYTAAPGELVCDNPPPTR